MSTNNECNTITQLQDFPSIVLKIIISLPNKREKYYIIPLLKKQTNGIWKSYLKDPLEFPKHC